MPSLGSSCRRTLTCASRGSFRACSQAGFSLLEVLITVMLLSLVYAIAIPSIGRTRVEASVHNSAQAIIGTLSLAKAAAVRFGRPSVLRLDSDRDRLWVEIDTTVAGSGATDTLGYFSFREELRVDLRANRAAVCFDGRGIGTTRGVCPEAGAVIIVSLAKKADTVFVSPLGRVLTR
jgi:type II secretion system protein H